MRELDPALVARARLIVDSRAAALKEAGDVIMGMNEGRWVLLDFVDFVVHVFHPSMRAYYQLERLWGDAPALAVSP